MGRARSVKPDSFLDEQLGPLPGDAFKLYMGLKTLADRDGRLEEQVRRIKACLFPYSDVDVLALLVLLEDAGLISRYEFEGVALIAVVKFADEENPHPKEPSRGLPAPQLAAKKHGKTRRATHASRRVPALAVSCFPPPSSCHGNGYGFPDADAPGASPPLGQPSLADAPPAVTDPHLSIVPEKPPEPQPDRRKATPEGARRHALGLLLTDAYAELREEKYHFHLARDANVKAIKDLDATGDPPEQVVARWRFALSTPDKYQRCDTLTQFARRYGSFGPQGSAVKAAGPPPKAIAANGYVPTDGKPWTEEERNVPF